MMLPLHLEIGYYGWKRRSKQSWGIGDIRVGTYIELIIKKRDIMYEIVKEFVCSLTGVKCVVVRMNGVEMCLEAKDLDDQIVEALRLGR